jgi:hypothetical protein
MAGQTSPTALASEHEHASSGVYLSYARCGVSKYSVYISRYTEKGGQEEYLGEERQDCEGFEELTFEQRKYFRTGTGRFYSPRSS